MPKVARVPPGFVRDRARSRGDARAENLLIRGDNEKVLEKLLPHYRGKVRLVYLDPPYNTGRTFAHYKDARTPDGWQKHIAARLPLCRELLSDEGSLVAQIDDTELAPLGVELDRVFGRPSRMATVTLVRSATTGHKARNPGLVNVADYLYLYAKDRTRWKPRRLFATRDTYDRAYRLYLENRADPPDAWRIVPLLSALRAKNPDATWNDAEAFALEHAHQVVRYATPRFEAVSKKAQALIQASRAEPKRTFVLTRPPHAPFFLRAGNRILFLSDKVREEDGRHTLVEPLSNVWDDIPFQGIAKEGGVVFVRNKKPERLMKRILELTTDEGDLVLDAYLGSGTTAAVAHKMGRRWIGIEEGEAFDALALPRLTKVVEGKDETGISRALGFRGGGGFHAIVPE